MVGLGLQAAVALFDRFSKDPRPVSILGPRAPSRRYLCWGQKYVIWAYFGLFGAPRQVQCGPKVHYSGIKVESNKCEDGCMVFLLSLDWDWRTVRLKLSSFYRKSSTSLKNQSSVSACLRRRAGSCLAQVVGPHRCTRVANPMTQGLFL